MGYLSDLAKNKTLQNNVSRHNDNYSSLNLEQDLILVTALISEFLQTTDFSDRELFSINRKELCELIELKRKLFETNIKLVDLEFKQDILVRKLNKYSKEDFQNAIESILSLLQEEVGKEIVMKVVNRLPEVMAAIP